MTGLYPIIRRKRRPFLREIPETPKPETLKTESVQPVTVPPVAAKKVVEAVPARPTKPKSGDAKNPTSPAAP